MFLPIKSMVFEGCITKCLLGKNLRLCKILKKIKNTIDIQYGFRKTIISKIKLLKHINILNTIFL